MRDPTKPFSIVPVIDPAIDWSATSQAHVARGGKRDSAMAEYRASGYDESMLRYADGEQPARYHARPLSRLERRTVSNEATDSDRYDLAFRLAFLRVERGRFMDGTRRDFVRPSDEGSRGRPLPEADMELIPEAAIQEVGQAIWARSFLDPFSEHVLPLPPTSLLALTSRYYRPSPAEQTSGTSSSETTSDAAAGLPDETQTP